MNIEYLVSNVSQLIIGVAVICTLVSVITEFTKEIGFLRRIPTALQVLVLSVIVCEIVFFAYLDCAGIRLVWYYPIAVIFAAFIVAIICCKGWDYLIDIWRRYYRKGKS